MAIKINGTLESNITSKILANTDNIYDKRKSKFQEVLNEELRNLELAYATYTKSSTGVITNIKLYTDSAKTTQVSPVLERLYIDNTAGSAYIFKWNGSTYEAVGGTSLVIGEIQGTAFDGLRGKNLEDSVSTINSSLASIRGDISSLESSISIIRGNVSTLETSLLSVENTLSTLSSTLSTVEVSVSTLEEDLSNLETSVSTIEENLSIVETSLSSLQNQVQAIPVSSIPTTGDASASSFSENEAPAKLYVANVDAFDSKKTKNGVYLYMGDRWDSIQHYDNTKVTIY